MLVLKFKNETIAESNNYINKIKIKDKRHAIVDGHKVYIGGNTKDSNVKCDCGEKYCAHAAAFLFKKTHEKLDKEIQELEKLNEEYLETLSYLKELKNKKTVSEEDVEKIFTESQEIITKVCEFDIQEYYIFGYKLEESQFLDILSSFITNNIRFLYNIKELEKTTELFKILGDKLVTIDSPNLSQKLDYIFILYTRELDTFIKKIVHKVRFRKKILQWLLEFIDTNPYHPLIIKLTDTLKNFYGTNFLNIILPPILKYNEELENVEFDGVKYNVKDKWKELFTILFDYLKIPLNEKIDFLYKYLDYPLARDFLIELIEPRDSNEKEVIKLIRDGALNPNYSKKTQRRYFETFKKRMIRNENDFIGMKSVIFEYNLCDYELIMYLRKKSRKLYTSDLKHLKQYYKKEYPKTWMLEDVEKVLEIDVV